MNYMLEYPGSALLYISVVLCAVMLARIVPKTSKYSNVIILIITLLLSVMSGVRAPSVGIDTAGYIDDTFHYLSIGNFAAAYGEIGFKTICRVLLFISGENAQFALFGLAFLIHGLVLMRYKELKDNYNYSLIVFVYLCLNFLPAMNGMAQYLASSVIFWSTRYLKKGKYFSFIIGIAIATTIHATSIIGVLFLFVYLLAQKKKRKKQRITLYTLLFLLPILGIFAYRYLMQYTKFARYFRTYMVNQITDTDIGLMLPLKLLVMFGILCLIVFSKSRISKRGLQRSSINDELLCVYVCIVGSLLQGLGFFYAYLDRLAMSFSLFEPILASRKSQSIRFTLVWLLRALLVLAAIYTFYVQLAANGSRIMPYIIANS